MKVYQAVVVCRPLKIAIIDMDMHDNMTGMT
jgi:hypothetical protein